MELIERVRQSNYLIHKTKKHSLLRFIGLVIIIVAYVIFMSMKYGAGTGVFATVLTWSFFVFCTPIADAGFILAFPVRIITGIKMIYTQLFSYLIATVINIYAFFVVPSIYNTTFILKMFYRILAKPYPFWLIIIISFIGTILSIYFGDEMIDVSKYNQREKYKKHINKYRVIILVFLIVFIIMLYKFLLRQLGITI